MVGKADLGVRKAHLQPGFADEAVGLNVGGGEVGHNPGRLQQVPLARGPGPLEIAVVGVDIGLVDGDILADQIAHALHHPADEAEEIGDVIALGECALLLQPEGVAEVVEGEQGADAAPNQGLQLLPVVGNHGVVEHAVLRLHPAPLHAQPAALDAHTGHQLQVLLPADIVVRSYGGVAAVLDAALAVPCVPAVVLTAALDLGGGGRRAQQQARLELKIHCASFFLFFSFVCKEKKQKKNFILVSSCYMLVNLS